MRLPGKKIALSFVLAAELLSPCYCAPIDDAADLRTQQAQEKLELDDMKGEIKNLRSQMADTMGNMERLHSQTGKQQQSQDHKGKEFRLQAKESVCELMPGLSANVLTYNGEMPGPVIRVREGDAVRIVLNNQLKNPTSFYIQGMILPHQIAGLPRKGFGLASTGESCTFQFTADQVGTFCYHPQVPQLDQMSGGLFGALVVEPRSTPKTYERDFVLVISEVSDPHAPLKNPTKTGQASAGGQGHQQQIFLVNGKSAPAIPALDVQRGERIRLRLINLSQSSCPLNLGGHKLEVVSQNGSDSTEPHVTRDTITLGAAERMDVEFVADNPGVWSLSSSLPAQSSYQGKFPGGIALIVRYPQSTQ